MGPDKIAAYRTLYTVLDGLARLLAPFTPFVAEEIYLALRSVSPADDHGESVHLELYPRPDASSIDDELERHMEIAMAVASLGRTVRNDAKIRVRQPLSEIVVHAGPGVDSADFAAFLKNEEIVSLVLDELNIRAISSAETLDAYVNLKAAPNFPALGKRFGKRVPEVVKAVAELDIGQLQSFRRTGTIDVAVAGGRVELTRGEVSVGVDGKDHYGASEDGGMTVILNLEITEALKLEGLAREIINRLQNLRKKAGLEVTDRIRIRYQGGEEAARVFRGKGTLIESETLASDITAGTADWRDSVEFRLDGEHYRVWIQRAE
jgi:isoleucyl-tRNA synthetase